MFTLIVNTTNGCNLDCDYCSLGKKTDSTKISKTMFFDILEYTYQLGHKEFTVILHGGEPTIVPMSIFRYGIVEMKEKYPDMTLHIRMQTNGFLLNDSILNFCHEFDVGVGISFDGNEDTHNQQRHIQGGGDSYQQIKNNILKYKNAGIPLSTLLVLTKKSMDSTLDFLHFLEENDLDLKVNPLLSYGNAVEHEELALQSGDYASFIIDMFRYAIKERVQVVIEPIQGIVEALLNDTSMKTCTFHKNCHENFLCIDYLGDIYSCGKFSHIPDSCLGNIATASGVLNHAVISDDVACSHCPYLKYCNGGCDAERLIGGTTQYPLCEEYKILFRYFFSEGFGLLKEQLLEEKKKREALLSE